jgi:K+ transporter
MTAWMNFRVGDRGSPRTWVLIVGVLLIAFPFSQSDSSAAYGVMLIIGAVLVVGVFAHMLLQRVRRR